MKTFKYFFINNFTFFLIIVLGSVLRIYFVRSCHVEEIVINFIPHLSCQILSYSCYFLLLYMSHSCIIFDVCTHIYTFCYYIYYM